MTDEEGPEITELRNRLHDAGWRTRWEREDSFFGDVRWQLMAEKPEDRRSVWTQANVSHEELRGGGQLEADKLCRARVLGGWQKIAGRVLRAEGVRE